MWTQNGEYLCKCMVRSLSLFECATKYFCVTYFHVILQSWNLSYDELLSKLISNFSPNVVTLTLSANCTKFFTISALLSTHSRPIISAHHSTKISLRNVVNFHSLHCAISYQALIAFSVSKETHRIISTRKGKSWVYQSYLEIFLAAKQKITGQPVDKPKFNLASPLVNCVFFLVFFLKLMVEKWLGSFL